MVMTGKWAQRRQPVGSEMNHAEAIEASTRRVSVIVARLWSVHVWASTDAGTVYAMLYRG